MLYNVIHKFGFTRKIKKYKHLQEIKIFVKESFLKLKKHKFYEKTDSGLKR